MKTNAKEVKVVGKVAFPDYSGRKFFLSHKFPIELDSFWDEGSRTYFSFVDLETQKVFEVHSNHPAFEPNQPRTLRNPQALPVNVVLVSRAICMGHESGITVYCRQEQLVKFLPEVNPAESLV